MLLRRVFSNVMDDREKNNPHSFVEKVRSLITIFLRKKSAPEIGTEPSCSSDNLTSSKFLSPDRSENQVTPPIVKQLRRAHYGKEPKKNGSNKILRLEKHSNIECCLGHTNIREQNAYKQCNGPLEKHKYNHKLKPSSSSKSHCEPSEQPSEPGADCDGQNTSPVLNSTAQKPFNTRELTNLSMEDEQSSSNATLKSNINNSYTSISHEPQSLNCEYSMNKHADLTRSTYPSYLINEAENNKYAATMIDHGTQSLDYLLCLAERQINLQKTMYGTYLEKECEEIQLSGEDSESQMPTRNHYTSTGTLIDYHRCRLDLEHLSTQLSDMERPSNSYNFEESEHIPHSLQFDDEKLSTTYPKNHLEHSSGSPYSTMQPTTLKRPTHSSSFEEDSEYIHYSHFNTKNHKSTTNNKNYTETSTNHQICSEDSKNVRKQQTNLKSLADSSDFENGSEIVQYSVCPIQINTENHTPTTKDTKRTQHTPSAIIQIFFSNPLLEKNCPSLPAYLDLPASQGSAPSSRPDNSRRRRSPSQSLRKSFNTHIEERKYCSGMDVGYIPNSKISNSKSFKNTFKPTSNTQTQQQSMFKRNRKYTSQDPMPSTCNPSSSSRARPVQEVKIDMMRHQPRRSQSQLSSPRVKPSNEDKMADRRPKTSQNSESQAHNRELKNSQIWKSGTVQIDDKFIKRNMKVSEQNSCQTQYIRSDRRNVPSKAKYVEKNLPRTQTSLKQLETFGQSKTTSVETHGGYFWTMDFKNGSNVVKDATSCTVTPSQRGKFKQIGKEGRITKVGLDDTSACYGVGAANMRTCLHTRDNNPRRKQMEKLQASQLRSNVETGAKKQTQMERIHPKMSCSLSRIEMRERNGFLANLWLQGQQSMTPLMRQKTFLIHSTQGNSSLDGKIATDRKVKPLIRENTFLILSNKESYTMGVKNSSSFPTVKENCKEQLHDFGNGQIVRKTSVPKGNTQLTFAAKTKSGRDECVDCSIPLKNKNTYMVLSMVRPNTDVSRVGVPLHRTSTYHVTPKSTSETIEPRPVTRGHTRE